MKPLSVFVRHGESELNAHNRTHVQIATGRTDTRLTPFGEAQASEAGRSVAHIPLDFAVSSPLTRARHTAEIVLNRHPDPPGLFLCPNITERSLGKFEGLSFDQLRKNYPEYFSDPGLVHWRAHFEQCAPGGENLAQVERRVCDAYDILIRRLPQENLAMFSHVMALRCLLGKLLSLPREEIPRLVIPNAMPLILERSRPPKLVGAFSIDDLRAAL
ncbi:MAG: histidine phosphatase family protein [Candidatus Peribacteraceae bacterium]|nr:histidine phosphatase family protein [Candidatus Peribacteraceae bacterium]MDD5742187.1 histidine phosphatase family protein [Candidatus Peribacteraceae bacterium]